MYKPNTPYITQTQTVKHLVLLKNFISNPNISVGDYTYYHDNNNRGYFEYNNVIGVYASKLVIGKFCQIATNTRFILCDMNHAIGGFSTYPFEILRENLNLLPSASADSKAITVGNDVWFGTNAVIMPSVTIGDGAIIGAFAVVTKDVAPYTIVVGNSARMTRQRFPNEIIDELLTICWWDWDYDKIMRNIPAIIGADISKLRNAR